MGGWVSWWYWWVGGLMEGWEWGYARVVAEVGVGAVEHGEVGLEG